MHIDTLVKLAENQLVDMLREMDRKGEPFEGRVWAYFDATQVPGRGVAVAQFQNRGQSLKEATEHVEALIQEQTSKGQVFTLGLMIAKGDLNNLLVSVSPGGKNPLTEWLKKPVPSKNHFPVVVIAGRDTKAFFMEFSVTVNGQPLN